MPPAGQPGREAKIDILEYSTRIFSDILRVDQRENEMIRFPVEAVGPSFEDDQQEYAVYVEVSEAGNDRALFLVYDSKLAALAAADLFTNLARQYNNLFPQGQPNG